MSRALGRGLQALLPDAGEAAGVQQVALERIVPNPYQPRLAFDEAALAELAASIEQHGLVQPICLRPAPDGERYQLVAGERRWRAAQRAGLATIPALIRPCSERELLEIALVENLQRENINPLEAAAAYRRLIDEFALTQEQVAVKVGRSRAAVANTLRLLKLAAEVRDRLADGRLTEGHARALLMLVDEDQQVLLARRIERDQLSVRDAEEEARALQGRPARRRPQPLDPPPEDVDLAVFAERLERLLGTRCQIRPRRGEGGTILIEYYTVEDLERIAEALGG